ncbi:acetyl-CoA synthetase-like protein [Fistulina hepatica ATCC 64428]|uniref:Acetyl-CoA synthetase-like protein n=1 Tax=Fistulina hepatica ATCC 64428 TaxID=1128425 RepID=A0A0D7AQ73_9AGAR|nr:acetyl-CoA synthetase-like protein [Fistulina hepatica ATCC 64428]
MALDLAAISQAFKKPPLDEERTVAELFDWHFEHNPEHPVFVYRDDDGILQILRHKNVVPAMHAAGRYVINTTGVRLDVHPRPTVAILAATDTITFATTVVGMERAGITIYLLSPRNSPAATTHLLTKMGVDHVLVSPEPRIRQLIERAGEGLDLHVFPMPRFEDLYKDQPINRLPYFKPKDDFTSIIVHSSGSTNFPKPILWPSRFEALAAKSTRNSSLNWSGEIYGFPGLVVFHSLGELVCRHPSATGMILGVFPPKYPAVIPTPEASFKCLVDTGATLAMSMPSNLEAWSKDPHKIQHLARLNLLMYGAGDLPQGVGDKLVRGGVKLCTVYGVSEAGGISGFPPNEFWNYWTPNPNADIRFRPLGNGTFEPISVASDCATQTIAVKNTTYDGRPAYATNDVVVPHPTRPGVWRVVGRIDDQIMLSTGEKTNPGPLEGILKEHPWVGSSVMFGRSRFQNGIVIMPTKEHTFDPKERDKLEAFKDEIWPQVEKMNIYAPTHSRLIREMILVADPARPFPLTPKGDPRRRAVLAEYEKDIDELYLALEDAPQRSNVPAPTEWTPDATKDFIRAVVYHATMTKVGDSDDLFAFGCNRQATYIRNDISGALKEAGLFSDIPTGVVYDHPTVYSLSNYIHAVSSNLDAVERSSEKNLEDLVSQYTRDWPARAKLNGVRPHEVEGDVVLLTGSTGSLGTAILAHLVEAPSVSRIYAFNRPSSGPRKATKQEQEELLKLRGYNPELAKSPKVVYVDGTLSREGLNVANDLQEEIRASITHILHIAWNVDWKLSILSFEDCVAGVRGLVDLALTSPRPEPPRLLFTSSVAVVRSTFHAKHSDEIPEAPITDARVPFGQGYGESKWVAEQILATAQEATSLRPVVARLGQISGGPNGSWNKRDWVPALVKSSVSLKCVVSWVSLDDAAKILIEARNSEHTFVHLFHPRPIPWNLVTETCAKYLGLSTVPYSEWFDRLERTVSSGIDEAKRSALPAGMLVDFFRTLKAMDGTVGKDEEALGMPKMALDNAMSASPTMRNMKQLSENNVIQWISFWTTIGFL